MKRIFPGRWAAGFTVAAAALLSACGGGSAGDTASGPALSAPVTSMASRVQPASAVQDVASIKSRSAEAAPRAVVVSLTELDMAKTAAAAPTVGPRLVGMGRDVDATKSASATQAQWKWTDTAAGGKVAAISFQAKGAYGVRLGVLVDQLPGSALLRVYTQAAAAKPYQVAGQEILQIIERNQAAGDRSDAARTWWTPDTGEGEATLEVELPPGVPASALRISVPQLSHIFENLSLPTEADLADAARLGTKNIGDSDLCNLDATCYNDGASERNAVARMVFVKSGLTYSCTGTLLNDGNSSGTPYFLSANHCISEQTAASTLQTNWFFRSSSCNSGALQSASTRKVGGARLLYASADTDISFMQLNDTPPAGAVFAGWDATSVATGSSIIGLHHPSSDLLKLSLGAVAGQSSCASISATQFQCSGSTGNFYRVTWSQGTTEGGSSGSAIFRAGKVIGTLYGGSAICSNRASLDYYGRLDVAYNAALKNWLAPTVSSSRTPIYRFFNIQTGAHFFTANAAERDFVIQTYPQFQYENIAFYAYGQPTAGQSTVFRFFNTSNGAHFYTINQAESDFVRANYPVFKYEGPIWYAQATAAAGTTPIYRFYKPSTGTHFYTVNAAERDFIIANYRDFQYENIAYYAWTSQ
ncbi:MAG: trypsin-like peptidase domain-containing protein [Acidovorax sp.]|uniref:trypsin-like peptidase domain-containing protein n=1 Tax=Acidovorax sp. TaxID=1872122 RepID=UPI00262B7F7F|nr:trypsin-like peptidase domain-containing protein [Acidovorax sp.]MDH4425175.1 trypsin-like peptidase domain-containing protein [Acidovorax sp.]